MFFKQNNTIVFNVHSSKIIETEIFISALILQNFLLTKVCLTCGHILHWYFLTAACGWEGCGGGSPGPSPDCENTLAPLIGCGTRTEPEEVGGEEDAADSGLAVAGE